MGRLFNIVLKSNQEKKETTFDSKDDFVDTLKAGIDTYVFSTTVKNEYPLTSVRSEQSLRDDNGNPVALREASANGQVTFTSDTAAGRGMTESTPLHSFSIVKGKLPKTTENSYTAAEYLRDVNLNNGNSVVAKDTERVVAENNGGFSENNQFTTENGRPKTEKELKPGYTQFRKPGVFPGRKYPTATEDSTAELSKLSIAELTRVGTLMMLEASGEAVIPDASTPEFDLIAELQSSAPAVARTFGGKVSSSRFAARKVIKHIKKDFQPAENTNFLDGRTTLSWGNTNSFLAPFEGLTALPSITSATILIATVTTAILGLSGIINTIKVDNVQVLSNQPPGEQRDRFMGSWRGKRTRAESLGVRAAAQLNLTPITHAPGLTLRKGLEVFFGQQESGNTGATAGQAVANVAAGVGSTVPFMHGYYNTVLRTVVRSLIALGYPVASAVETASSGNDYGDIRREADPTVLIRRLANSPLISFINILLMIGDKALTQEDQQRLYGGDNAGTATQLLSGIDSIRETVSTAIPSILNDSRVNDRLLNPAVLISKNRLSNGRLAMSNATARSLFHIPSNLGEGLDNFGTTISDASNQLSVHNTVKRNGTGKIDPEIARALEEHLESDYMPFYFQDMRTNEILSFHAFLNNLSEDISAEYTDSEGFGRLGKVYTYKNTNRNIGFGFTLVATSDDDFDLMWYKINRLAMMLYPQWSEGRRITHEGKRFIQPFSQVIAASPLVRVRLGDLWKSNYNKLSVARLFGYGGSGFNVGSQTAQTTQNPTDTDLEARVQRELAAEPTTYQVGEQVQFNGIRGDTYPVVNSAYEVVTENFVVSPAPVKIVYSPPDNPEYKIVEYAYPQPSQPAVFKFKVPASELRRDPAAVRRRLSAQTQNATTTSTTQEQLGTSNSTQQFFSTENPILRSFDSAMGKGIAGFFKAMRMNYEETRWATEKFNGRAPIMVKIDMEFALIHDLQPGLGPDGFMSAPIWNVGNVMKNITGTTNEQTEQRFIGNKSAAVPSPRQEERR